MPNTQHAALPVSLTTTWQKILDLGVAEQYTFTMLHFANVYTDDAFLHLAVTADGGIAGSIVDADTIMKGLRIGFSTDEKILELLKGAYLPAGAELWAKCDVNNSITALVSGVVST